ncbi:phosphoribosyl-AMP cyclohydrolase [Flaviflexus massiliensis]|uniref:phosphoribosyl-AMP cyclohydrolase n=1 Tax=Flaviflexus massiliensis TaxID=1522309 RepID=UPI0009E9C656|nr:phosphoribosyl-AMP cyclohydrolase [Flaviflexus massiliensis]
MTGNAGNDGNSLAETSGVSPARDLSVVTFNDVGLVPAIIQDHENGRVLMMGWMNEEALTRTQQSGRVWFWSRSRGEYWRKGDTSGHRQYVRGIEYDCDGDTLLIQVKQVGAACHTGARSCFDNRTLEAVTDHDEPNLG